MSNTLDYSKLISCESCGAILDSDLLSYSYAKAGFRVLTDRGEARYAICPVCKANIIKPTKS